MAEDEARLAIGYAQLTPAEREMEIDVCGVGVDDRYVVADER